MTHLHLLFLFFPLFCFVSSLFLHRAHRRVFVVCSDIPSSKPLVTSVYSPYFLGARARVCVCVCACAGEKIRE